MTQLSIKIVQCPKCGRENRIVYYASINTFMDIDGSLIAKLLNGTLNTSKCEKCGVKIRLSLDVLINCPKAMFYLNPADDFEYKKEQLKANGIVSEKEMKSARFYWALLKTRCAKPENIASIFLSLSSFTDIS